jgi:hypothetical protein
MTRTSRSHSLATGANIGVPNESYVLDLLDGHNAYQRPGLLVAPEHNTLIDFILQFLDMYVDFGRISSRDPARGEAFERVRFWLFLSVEAAL